MSVSRERLFAYLFIYFTLGSVICDTGCTGPGTRLFPMGKEFGYSYHSPESGYDTLREGNAEMFWYRCHLIPPSTVSPHGEFKRRMVIARHCDFPTISHNMNGRRSRYQYCVANTIAGAGQTNQVDIFAGNRIKRYLIQYTFVKC